MGFYGDSGEALTNSSEFADGCATGGFLEMGHTAGYFKNKLSTLAFPVE